jgi:hypothetical protein
MKAARALTVNFSFVYGTFHDLISADTSRFAARLVMMSNALTSKVLHGVTGKNLKGGCSSVV